VATGHVVGPAEFVEFDAYHQEAETTHDWLHTGFLRIGVHVLLADPERKEVHILIPAAHVNGLLAEAAAKNYSGHGKLSPFCFVAARCIEFQDGCRTVSCCSNPLCNPGKTTSRQDTFLQDADWSQHMSASVQSSVLDGGQLLCDCARAALLAAGSSPEAEGLSQSWLEAQRLRLLGAVSRSQLVPANGCGLSDSQAGHHVSLALWLQPVWQQPGEPLQGTEVDRWIVQSSYDGKFGWAIVDLTR
jgi:hypothetical protein